MKLKLLNLFLYNFRAERNFVNKARRFFVVREENKQSERIKAKSLTEDNFAKVSEGCKGIKREESENHVNIHCLKVCCKTSLLGMNQRETVENKFHAIIKLRFEILPRRSTWKVRNKVKQKVVDKMNLKLIDY